MASASSRRTDGLWIRLEWGRPTRAGFLAGLLFAAAPAAVPGIVLGRGSWLATVVIAGLAGAFSIRHAAEVAS